MDQFQLKQFVDEAIAKHVAPGQPRFDPEAIAAEIAQTHRLESTEEVEKMIQQEAINLGLKFGKPTSR